MVAVIGKRAAFDGVEAVPKSAPKVAPAKEKGLDL
jgi:hypothetical protein